MTDVEYGESIERINRVFRRSKGMKFAWLATIICLISAIVLMSVGIVSAKNNSESTPGITLIIISSAVAALGFIVFAVGLALEKKRINMNLEEAIEDESLKYLMGSPSCSWKLQVDQQLVRSYRYEMTNVGSTHVPYKLVEVTRIITHYKVSLILGIK